MAYQFFQIVGLEKPADLRRARAALAQHTGRAVTFWVDPLDQVAWLERPDEPFSDDEVEQARESLAREGFWVWPIDQSQVAGPPCIARHRQRRLRHIRTRLVRAILIGIPIVLLHLLPPWLLKNPDALWPAWLQMALTVWLFVSGGKRWFYHGLRALRFGRWRWRTGMTAVLAGCWTVAALDTVSRTLGGPAILSGPPAHSLFAPAMTILAMALLRAWLLRWRLAQISTPFDRWLAEMNPQDEAYLRFFLRIQARHQRSGLDLSWGRLADRFIDVGLAVVAAAFLGVWLISGQLNIAWIIAAGLLLVLDPRLFQLAWMAPEVLAERQAVAKGIFFANPRVFQTASRVDVVAFDKTGTVTVEPAELADVQVNPLAALDLDADELLRLAASVEQGSPHPAAQALVAAAGQRGLKLEPIRGLQRHSGLGVAGDVAGRRVHVGSARYLKNEGLDLEPFQATIAQMERNTFSVILVGVDGQVAGALGITDVLRGGTERAVAELQSDGYDVRLITGDTSSAGASVAAMVGIAQVVAELPPQRKLALVERWRHKDGHVVAIVARARKDPQLLAAADISIALCDTARDEHAAEEPCETGKARVSETGQVQLGRSDVLLLDNQIARAPTALRVARQVGLQRRFGFAWMVTLVGSLTALATGWPLLLPGAQWSPAVVAALTLLGLPVILGRTRVRASSSDDQLAHHAAEPRDDQPAADASEDAPVETVADDDGQDDPQRQ